ncbi:MAG: hypothetical protein IJS14_04710 [Lentisphaeria bacterium]|nr:hypothetical protein [Lentisphaeria bacterium]
MGNNRFVGFLQTAWQRLANLTAGKKDPASRVLLTRQEQSISACATLESGFGNVEDWGVWSTAKTSVISLVLPKWPRKLTLNFRVQAFGKVKAVDIQYESRKIGHWTILQCAPTYYLLDCSKLPRGKRIRIAFQNDEMSRPCDLVKGSTDGRTLGIGLCSLRVMD